MEWSHEQVAHWRTVFKDYLADIEAVHYQRGIDIRRQRVQQQMVTSLHAFLDGSLTVREFNSIFQQKTHEEWNVFGLRGLSGGMFLNKLVKYIPDEEQLGHHLRKWLCVPVTTDLRYARRRMHAFIHFLEDLIATQQVTRFQLQPSRVPFLVSAWWHLQESKQWPIFYPLVHAVLASSAGQELLSGNPIEDYIAFRQRFLSLAHTLNLSLWELEHVCTWYGQKHLEERNMSRETALSLTARRRNLLFTHQQRVEDVVPTRVLPSSVVNVLDEEETASKQEPDTSSHTHLQWILAKIGQKVGCQVWIAINDYSKVWKNERLGDLSIKTLPILVGSVFQRIISRIDVLWLQGETVIAAYEIEHTTDISTGLLRLYDLGVLFLEQDLSLCIVTPTERIRRVQFELSRPLFASHEMRKRCILISEETLFQHEEHILRWAESPSVIRDLAYRVSYEVIQGA